MEKGATHYTHWFQPLTGSTAEKHDSFYAPDRRRHGDRRVLRQGADPGRARRLVVPDRRHPRDLRGARLHRLGPDLSPAFILENPNGALLCIPTAFTSWTGEALDHKIPLLRSMDALSTSAVARAASCSATRTPQRVFTTVGPEQEYFLIDEQYYFERPDLVTTGRTLFGAKPPKGHELDDHYFGSIPERILACMLEVEQRAGQARRADQDAPQRGRAEPVRGRADLRELERRLRPPAADDAGAAERRAPLRPRLPAAREAVRRRQRLGQAQQLVDGHRHGHEPARAGRHAAREPAVPVLLRGGHPGRQQAPGAAARVDRRRRARTTASGANEAPPAIISIFLGAELREGLRRDRDRARPARRRPGRFLGLGTPGAAAAADARRRPQPHEPVRLHRQQVRVPRARLDAVAVAARTRC